jgi:hypothetical protein
MGHLETIEIMKNLRWLAPVGLICAAGTVASAEVRLVVQNDSGRPYRLWSLQDTPTFTLHRFPAGAGSPSAEEKSMHALDEIQVGAKERIELQWRDAGVPSQTVRFALLHEGLAAPDGTTLAFTWNWKGEGPGTAVMGYPQETDRLRHAQRREAAATRDNLCLIRWASFTDPQGQPELQEAGLAGAGGGSGPGFATQMPAVAARNLPMGGAGKEPWAGAKDRPSLGAAPGQGLPSAPAGTGGAGAGAGAGSGSGLPTGPALVDIKTRMVHELAERARLAERRPESKLESKAQAERRAESKQEFKAPAGPGPLRVRAAEVRNFSGQAFNLSIRGVVEGSTFHQTSLEQTAAGDLSAAVRVPADSRTTLQLVGHSPFRPTVRITEERTPERAVQHDWQPLGGTPGPDGRSPARLRQLRNDGQPEAASRAFIRPGGAGTVVIEDYDMEAGARLTEGLDWLSLQEHVAHPGAGAATAADAGAAADAAPLEAAAEPTAATGPDLPAAGVGAGAGAGAVDLERATTFWDFQQRARDGAAEAQLDDLLDWTSVAAGGHTATKAIYRFLDHRSDFYPAFNDLSYDYVDGLVAALDRRGERDLTGVWQALLNQDGALQDLSRDYLAEGKRRLLADLEAELAQWRKHELVSAAAVQELRQRLHETFHTWIQVRVASTVRHDFTNRVDAAAETAPGTVVAGEAAGAGGKWRIDGNNLNGSASGPGGAGAPQA